MGDINIDISTSLNPSNLTHATDYTNMLASNNLFPLISLPTRVTERSSTIIDHNVTNDHEHSILPGIIRTDITDHYPIFCSIELSTLSKSQMKNFLNVIFNTSTVKHFVKMYMNQYITSSLQLVS